jgi:hypothetical protein
MQGLLRIWTDSGSISVMGFRARYNERRDFLVATLPPTSENDPWTSAERVFPQLISGGGVSTEIILFSPMPGPVRGVLRLYSQRGELVGPTLR